MRYLAIQGILLLLAVGVSQDETREKQTGVEVVAPGVRIETNVDRSDTADDEKSNHPARHVVRASQLIGLNVQNANDETIGEIHDIVLDPHDGEIRYVAFAAGGFLGVGEKLFAIPWRSFEWKHKEDEYKAVLHVDKEVFTNAQGFDKDNWPDMANEKWQLENNRVFEPRSAKRSGSTPTSPSR